ncbi:prefoldin subunit alpha [Candidatus Woesearchaeota archaeon]|nr:prefoldin subunit alpha [Candidatus Woesearchaeota archaeon]
MKEQEEKQEQEEKLQKKYLKFQMMEQYIRQLEKQRAVLNNQLIELIAASQSLEEIEKVDNGREILVPISNGIYAKADIKDNKSFIVTVGANVVTVKDINAVKKLVESQMEEMRKMLENLAKELEDYTAKASVLEQEIQEIASLLKDKE